MTGKPLTSDRTEKLQETEAYITIKNHKEDFPNKISCRLINLSISNIGKEAKLFLTRSTNKYKYHKSKPTEVHFKYN